MSTYELSPDAQDYHSQDEYEAALARWEQRQKSLKFLIGRTHTFEPAFGQYLHFGDGTVEWDAGCAQTTYILTAELRNGKAAKTADGIWVSEPGPRREYEWEYDLVGFWVGLQLIGRGEDGKEIYEFACKTPTGVLFWSNDTRDSLHVPPSWVLERVAAEVIMWICLGEDVLSESPSELTPQQLTWIRSINREEAMIEIDEWIEEYDRHGDGQDQYDRFGTEPEEEKTPMSAPTAEQIEKAAQMYLDRSVLYNQTSLVNGVLNAELPDLFSWDDIRGLYPDPDNMDAEEAAAYIQDEMGEDWRALVDLAAYCENPDDEDAQEEVEANVLSKDEVEVLRDHIRNNASPQRGL